MNPAQEKERRRREEALAALYETHYERVARYIFARLGDRQEAEDLASETFVRALGSLDRFEERGLPMEAWLFRIAHNLLVDHIRKRSRAERVPLDGIPVRSDADPAEDAQTSEQIERLRRAMARLSPAQREVIGLRFYSGLSSEECARILNKKPGAVREMQSAALKTLRRALAQEFQGEQGI